MEVLKVKIPTKAMQIMSIYFKDDEYENNEYI